LVLAASDAKKTVYVVNKLIHGESNNVGRFMTGEAKKRTSARRATTTAEMQGISSDNWKTTRMMVNT
jgi:hypothetical protein